MSNLSTKLAKLQIREVHIRAQEVVLYQVLRGDLWSSGYDQRVGEEIERRIHFAPDCEHCLRDGEYIVTFFPYRESQGWDAVSELIITPKGEDRGI